MPRPPIERNVQLPKEKADEHTHPDAALEVCRHRPGPAVRPRVRRTDPIDLTSPAGPATLAEVTHLWWFSDGAIMDDGIRHHLWRSWGLCPRHAWLYFRVENEIKYQPLGNAILHEDLISRAAHLINSHHRPHRNLLHLATSDSCLTCDHLASASTGRASFTSDLNTVRTGTRTHDWLASGRDIWSSRRCPRCPTATPQAGAGEASPKNYGHEVPCRLHVDDRSLGDLAAYLLDLAARLHGCITSMTADGPPRAPDSDAALVEALGWVAGWPSAPG